MIDCMYYDSFSNEYVMKPDETAPPERYAKTLRGTNGIYIDSWWVESNGEKMCLDVAYLPDEYYDGNIHDQRLIAMCEKNNCKPIILRHFVLPSEKFDEYAKRFGLCE